MWCHYSFLFRLSSWAGLTIQLWPACDWICVFHCNISINMSNYIRLYLCTFRPTVLWPEEHSLMAVFHRFSRQSSLARYWVLWWRQWLKTLMRLFHLLTSLIALTHLRLPHLEKRKSGQCSHISRKTKQKTKNIKNTSHRSTCWFECHTTLLPTDLIKIWNHYEQPHKQYYSKYSSAAFIWTTIQL